MDLFSHRTPEGSGRLLLSNGQPYTARLLPIHHHQRRGPQFASTGAAGDQQGRSGSPRAAVAAVAAVDVEAASSTDYGVNRPLRDSSSALAPIAGEA